MNYLIGFWVSFVLVGLKATQQQNVIYQEYWYVMTTSMLLAFCEVTLILLIVRNTWWVALPIGIGAGLGAMTAMYLHKKWIRKD